MEQCGEGYAGGLSWGAVWLELGPGGPLGKDVVTWCRKQCTRAPCAGGTMHCF